MANLLNQIQQKLKAPKNQKNTFGNYKYRSCEDILTAVKPLLGGGTLVIEDEIVLIGERVYIRATATLKTETIYKTDEKNETLGVPQEALTEKWTSKAFAREPLSKKGMDEAQITGATSSYARKYALNGLFAIDDINDADAANKHEKDVKRKEEAKEIRKTSTNMSNALPEMEGKRKDTIQWIARHFDEKAKETPLPSKEYHDCRLAFLSELTGVEKLLSSKVLTDEQLKSAVTIISKTPKIVSSYISRYLDKENG